MNKLFRNVFFITLLLTNVVLHAQERTQDIEINYFNPKAYKIGKISVSGVEYMEDNVIIVMAGLNVGDEIKIPGDKISDAIRNIWKQGLVDNVKINVTDIKGDTINLEIELTERPRLSTFKINGIKAGEITTIKEKIKLKSGDVVTDYLLSRTKNIIENHYLDKGFPDCDVSFKQIRDTAKANMVSLSIEVSKAEKIKIQHINIIGNERLSEKKAKAALKETKEKGIFTPLKNIEDLLLDALITTSRLNFSGLYDSVSNYLSENVKLRIFKASKFIKENYEEDKIKLIEKYNTLGFRDAKIIGDSIHKNDDSSINIDISVEEGNKFYFRNITWVGNTKYTSPFLSSVLNIKKGDVYNKELLDKSLSYNPAGMDVSSLYMDDGYLFFQANPVEVLVENDSIDIEVRINEGEQATINKISVKGNNRTNDYVVLREIRTRPGELFSREKLIRTTRELAQLKYFDPEKIQPDVRPNEAENTVDIEYVVEETSSDQVELSGGWGYGRMIGTLGFSFNNFSLKNIFKKEAWRPIPFGDGQKLSIRMQTYGKGYFSYNFSFSEPWLGGKQPNSLSVSFYHSKFSNPIMVDEDGNVASFITNSMSVGLGKRLSWPDDFFSLYQGVNFQLYKLTNYANILSVGTGTGKYNNFNYNIIFSRNSVSAPIYPRYGSEFALSLEATPPYSLFSNKDYTSMSEDEKFKWIEYHKWKFSSAWYFELYNKFVLSTRAKFGFLGSYNSDIGITPFERFFLGGDGLSGTYNVDGREIVAMRGYQNETITPGYYQNKNKGGAIYAKYTLELRYPLSLNPSATIYAAAFIEAGNAWSGFSTFDPFDIKRAAGIGVRVFLPMLGVLGLDWAYGFDEIPGIPDANGSQFHFSMNKSLD